MIFKLLPYETGNWKSFYGHMIAVQRLLSAKFNIRAPSETVSNECPGFLDCVGHMCISCNFSLKIGCFRRQIVATPDSEFLGPQDLLLLLFFCLVSSIDSVVCLPPAVTDRHCSFSYKNLFSFFFWHFKLGFLVFTLRAVEFSIQPKIAQTLRFTRLPFFANGSVYGWLIMHWSWGRGGGFLEVKNSECKHEGKY